MEEFVFKQPVSKEIYEKKYALHGEQNIEETFRGVAKELASVEEHKEYWEEKFYEVLVQSKFIPAGRILANARVDSPMKNYMNCFVIPIEDSMHGIYTALYNDAMIGAVGGGVGLNISPLRPDGAPISKGGESSGPLSFLDIFDTSAKAIHTGGSRRSAHICILNIDHPDIEKFITYKRGDGNNKLTQFNISTGITDAFMQQVEKDGDWDLQFEGRVYKTIKARYLYDLITKNMYEHNEPGVFFLDTVNRYNNGYYMYEIESPNPCAEQALPPFGICCLGSLKLSSFVKTPFTSDATFDWEEYKQTISVAVRFLDNVLSVAEYPLPEAKERALNERRIGLGFTALADTFASLGITYGDEQAIDFAEKLGVILRDWSYTSSVLLAQEKGSFPAFTKEYLEGKFIKTLPITIQAEIAAYGIRNIALNNVPPTGTTSLSIGNNCSSGIEPIFATEYTRNVTQLDGSKIPQTVYNEAWLDYQEITGQTEKPDYFVTSSELSLDAHVKTQAVFQRYIDAAISKTIQLPDKFTFEEYQNLIMDAWKLGLKGITTYNPNGSLAPILTTEKTPVQPEPNRHAKKRPESLPCDIYELTVNKQRMVVLVGKDEETGQLYEVFLTADPDKKLNLNKAKSGFIKKTKRGKYDLIVNNEVLLENLTALFDDDYAIMCRLLSLSMRHNVPLQFIVDQLNKTSRFDNFSKTVGRVLKGYLKEGEKALTESSCPDCGETVVFVEGCKTCVSCGWSKC